MAKLAGSTRAGTFKQAGIIFHDSVIQYRLGLAIKYSSVRQVDNIIRDLYLIKDQKLTLSSILGLYKC